MRFKPFILFTLLIMLLGVLPLKAESQSLGRVVFVIGRVKVKTEDSSHFTRLSRGFSFKGGERVKTSRGAVLRVQLKNGSVIKILPNSTVIINKVSPSLKGDRFSFGIIKGGMHSKVQKLGKRSYHRIYTPSHVAGVRGTEFSVFVANNGKAQVRVKEGWVKFQGDRGAEEVRRGEAAEASLTEQTRKVHTNTRMNINSNTDQRSNRRFQKTNKQFQKPIQEMNATDMRMRRIQAQNRRRLRYLRQKMQSGEKLSLAEKYELEYLRQRTVNQCSGIYLLSRRIFKKYKNNPLIKRRFYEVQRSMRSIDDQIKDMDQFIDKMSKEIDDFTEKSSKNIDDMEKNFMK